MDNSDNQPGNSRAFGKRSVSPSSGGHSKEQQTCKKLKSDGADTRVVTPEDVFDSDSFLSFGYNDDDEDMDDDSDVDFSTNSVESIVKQPSIPSSTFSVLSVEEIAKQMNERIEDASFN